jgi:hypothetical protein
MTFLHTRDGIALVTTCQLCGMSTRSLSESAIYASQRGHDALTCQLRRAQRARAISPEEQEAARELHVYNLRNARHREQWAARQAETRCATTVFGVVPGVETGRMGHSETVQSVNSEPPLSTPSSTRKEAVDS